MNQWAPLGDTMHITTLKTLGGYGYQREGQTVGKMFEAYFTRKATNKFVLDAGECAI